MEGNFLLLTFLLSLYYNEGDSKAFLLTTVLCYIVGLTCKWLGERNKENQRMSRADSFLIVSLSWVVFSLIGMIPFIMIERMDVASAFFETMSGFTTTGATCISDIDSMTHALKFWRSVTQWMGGLGIVVFSIALIPVYEMKNTNVFSAEVTGIGLNKLRPKIGSTARRLLIIYLVLTFACSFFYWIGPMNIYDAVCHSMTTIATGGFSTHTASIGYFHSRYLEYVAPFFMLMSSVNFSLYYYMSIGRRNVLFKNEEVRWFFSIVFIAVILFVLFLYFAPIPNEAYNTLPHGFENTFRSALFHVSSVITSTGYSAEKFDYVAWGPSFWMPTVVIMAIGSCAGSTAGGIKIVRIIISIKSLINQFIHQIHPRAVLPLRVNGVILENAHIRKTFTFIFLYIALVVIAMMCYTLLGSDVDTALGSSISMLSNVGPGTGSVGPASNFGHVPQAGKWLMSFYMLVGRLEIFTVLILFLPDFWKEKN